MGLVRTTTQTHAMTLWQISALPIYILYALYITQPVTTIYSLLRTAQPDGSRRHSKNRCLFVHLSWRWSTLGPFTNINDAEHCTQGLSYAASTQRMCSRSCSFADVWIVIIRNVYEQEQLVVILTFHKYHHQWLHISSRRLPLSSTESTSLWTSWNPSMVPRILPDPWSVM